MSRSTPRLALVVAALALLNPVASLPAALPPLEQGGRVLVEALLPPAGELTLGRVPLQVDPSTVKVYDTAAIAAESVLELETPGPFRAVTVLHALSPGRGIEDWRLATALAHRKHQLPPDWPEVAAYELVYADGAVVRVPVRFGEGIDSWHRVQTVAPMLLAREHFVVPLDAAKTEHAAWYAMRIPNPRPGKALAAVRLVPAAEPFRSWGELVVVAAGIERGEPEGRVIVVAPKPFGTSAAAGTLEAPLASIQAAVDASRPGDTILVRGGRYVVDEPVVIDRPSAEGKGLTLSAFPGESPLVDGWAIRNDPRVRPFAERGTSRVGRFEADTGVIHAMGDPDHLKILGMHVARSPRAGISAYGRTEAAAASGSNDTRPGWSTTRDIEIAFNTVYGTFSMGIICHVADDVRVIGNRVIRPHDATRWRDPVTDEASGHDNLPQEAIDLSRNRGFEIAFNEVTGGGKEAIDVISVEDGTIHHNYVEGCLNGIYIDSWTVPILRVKVWHNVVLNAFAGIPLATEGGSELRDIEIFRNVVVDAKASGIGVTEATYKAEPTTVSGHRVHHNTIVRSGHHATGIGWQGTGIDVAGFPDNPRFRDIVVADNIVTETSGRPLRNAYAATSAEREIVFTHNLVHPQGDSTPERVRRAARGGWDEAQSVLGDHPVAGDPLLRGVESGDYRLAAGSPALGAARDGGDLGALQRGEAWIPGLDFAGRVTSAYVGQTRWRPVDIPRDRFTAHRNHLERPSWFQRGRYGADFDYLPVGEQVFAGITFEIPEDADHTAPSVLVLRGLGSEVTAEAIRDIPVGRGISRLAFLHNYHVTARQQLERGTTLFRYDVRYADGQVVSVPVRLGIEIEDWQGGERATGDLPGARLAWTTTLVKRRSVDRLRLFAMTWENPRPDVVVQSIDLVTEQPFESGAPAVFAISTGDSR